MDAAYGARYAFRYQNHWWWQARAVVLRESLEACKLPANATILDVGCGDGLTFPLLEQFGQVWGVEVDANLLDPEGPNRDRICTEPLGSAVYESSRYDLITAFDVLEHIRDDNATLAAIESLLRPGGHVVVMVPAGTRLWTTHDEANRHYRRYTRSQLERSLATYFEILELRHVFALLVIPKFVLAQLERLRGIRGTAGKQVAIPPRPINAILRQILVLEWKIGRRLRPPVGTSLIAVARKTLWPR